MSDASYYLNMLLVKLDCRIYGFLCGSQKSCFWPPVGFFAVSGRCITLLYIYQKAICGVILMILSGVIQSYHEACAHQMRSNHCWSGRQKLSTHAHLEHPDFSSGLELLLRRCQPAHSNSIRGLQNPHYLFLYLSSALDKHQSPPDSIKLRAFDKSQ